MTRIRCHSPYKAREILDSIHAKPRGKKRNQLARNTQMGPFAGDGGNRIAGILNLEALLLVVENPDMIKINRVAWLLGWDSLDVITLLAWASARDMPWTRQLGRRCFALTEATQYIWRTERYNLLADPGIAEVVARD